MKGFLVRSQSLRPLSVVIMGGPTNEEALEEAFRVLVEEDVPRWMARRLIVLGEIRRGVPWDDASGAGPSVVVDFAT